MIIRRKSRNGERGQVLILCAISLVVLLLFIGLAVDFGMAYVTKARLGKAADAAALTGARYSAQPAYADLATSSFAMNYGPGAPVPTITSSTDANGNTLIGVTATATMNTSFLGLAGVSSLPVSSTAQSKAARVEMTLVLDRSGSMGSDGGSANLPAAVQTFIGYFDDKHDSVALVSFATTASTDVAMVPNVAGNFQQKIISIASGLAPGGHTFSDAALQLAFTQEMQPTTGNVSKVVVFFTDGGANTIQNTLACSGPTGPGGPDMLKSGVWNFGGDDPPSTDVNFMDPNTGVDSSCTLNGGKSCCSVPGTTLPGTFLSASQGGTRAPAWDKNGPLTTPWTQNSLPAPVQVRITNQNVQADAIYRAIGDANAMRAQGITVYVIGLGSAPNAILDKPFLCQVANDPGPECAMYFKYDPKALQGVMQWAPTGADLGPAFQAIATVIRLRLTQ
jgi:Flp pilus assembly protein TadG